MAGLRVPHGEGTGIGAGGLRDAGPAHPGAVHADAPRGQRQRRAAAPGPGTRRARELRDRAPRVPHGERRVLPADAAAERQRLPGAARGVGGGHVRRGRVAVAFQGEAAPPRQRKIQGIAVQAARRGEGAAQQPSPAVPASVTAALITSSLRTEIIGNVMRNGTGLG